MDDAPGDIDFKLESATLDREADRAFLEKLGINLPKKLSAAEEAAAAAAKKKKESKSSKSKQQQDTKTDDTVPSAPGGPSGSLSVSALFATAPSDTMPPMPSSAIMYDEDTELAALEAKLEAMAAGSKSSAASAPSRRRDDDDDDDRGGLDDEPPSPSTVAAVAAASAIKPKAPKPLAVPTVTITKDPSPAAAASSTRDPSSRTFAATPKAPSPVTPTSVPAPSPTSLTASTLSLMPSSNPLPLSELPTISFPTSSTLSATTPAKGKSRWGFVLEDESPDKMERITAKPVHSSARVPESDQRVASDAPSSSPVTATPSGASTGAPMTVADANDFRRVQLDDMFRALGGAAQPLPPMPDGSRRQPQSPARHVPIIPSSAISSQQQSLLQQQSGMPPRSLHTSGGGVEYGARSSGMDHTIDTGSGVPSRSPSASPPSHEYERYHHHGGSSQQQQQPSSHDVERDFFGRPVSSTSSSTRVPSSSPTSSYEPVPPHSMGGHLDAYSQHQSTQPSVAAQYDNGSGSSVEENLARMVQRTKARKAAAASGGMVTMDPRLYATGGGASHNTSHHQSQASSGHAAYAASAGLPPPPPPPPQPVYDSSSYPSHMSHSGHTHSHSHGHAHAHGSSSGYPSHVLPTDVPRHGTTHNVPQWGPSHGGSSTTGRSSLPAGYDRYSSGGQPPSPSRMQINTSGHAAMPTYAGTLPSPSQGGSSGTSRQLQYASYTSQGGSVSMIDPKTGRPITSPASSPSAAYYASSHGGSSGGGGGGYASHVSSQQGQQHQHHGSSGSGHAAYGYAPVQSPTSSSSSSQSVRYGNHQSVMQQHQHHHAASHHGSHGSSSGVPSSTGGGSGGGAGGLEKWFGAAALDPRLVRGAPPMPPNAHMVAAGKGVPHLQATSHR
jgi:hypothetical protein